jgi:non-specific serine/threonine protein kinase
VQFQFGDYSLDVDRRELRRGAELIATEPQVFDLLTYLIENRERVVTKDDLIEAVWRGRIVSESTLISRINAARRSIGDNGKDQQLIRTIARKGIRFIGAVAERGPHVLPTQIAVEAQPIEIPLLRQDAQKQGWAGATLNNLPLRRSSFLGREHDVASVRELLDSTNLVTLIGAGGIGKTSLALEIATGLLERYSHGVWFVALAPLADPNLVPSAVADALGLTEEPGRPLLSTLLNVLRTRQMLIVLDNCEHLVDACAQFVDSVLRVSRRTHILATSREPLGIGGELTWRVSSLPAPDPQEQISAAELTEYAAVRLFIDRAKFARASFQVTNESLPLVSQICWHLDGIPLAIELAASRVKAMQIEQIVERLDDRFRLLTGGSRTAMPHQQTLLSTIDWSYGLLSEAERVLLARLSVFSGGWTLEAAEAVCGETADQPLDVLDALTRLVDKSLVVLDERAAEPRYRMLETIRQYGQSRLAETGRAEDLSDRHLAYYTRLAEAVEPHFYHPDQMRWYAKTDRELDNVRGALEWSLKSGKIETGMRLVMALHRYWVARVYWMEATGWLKRLLARADLNEPTPIQAKAVFVAGHIANYYDPATAERLGADSLRVSRSLGYQQGVVNALWLLGWCCNPRLDGSAAPYYEESIALACAIDYPWGAAHAYAWSGVYRLGIGDYEGAKPLLEAAKVQAQRLGDDATLLGRCDGNLGLVALLQGDYAAAKAYLDNSLALVRAAGNKNGTAEALWFHGRLALRQGDHARAIGYFVESVRLYQLYSTSLWVTRGLAYLMIAHAGRGEARVAAQLAGALHETDRQALSIKEQLGSRAAIAEYDDALERIGAMLTRAELDAAMADGQRMTREQAIASVLAQPAGAPATVGADT